MSDATLESLLYILQYGTFAVAVILPIRVYLRRKQYIKTILSGWLWIFVWAVANCMIIPAAFTLFGYKSAFHFSPEMPGVVAVAVMGWLFGIYIALAIFIVALFIRAITTICNRLNKNA